MPLSPLHIRSRSQMLGASMIAGLALFAPSTAWADCSLSGSTVSCSGTSSGYTSTSNGLAVNIASGTAMTGNITVGASATVANSGGALTGTGTVLQVGDNSTINNGVLSTSGTTTTSSGGSMTSSGAPTVVMGNNGVFNNNGTLAASSSTVAAVQFGSNGTFNNSSYATAVVTGGAQFGTSTGAQVNSYTNKNLSYGVNGGVVSDGNTNIYNNGTLSGTITVTEPGATNTVFVNDINTAATSSTAATYGTYAGTLSIANTAAITNNGIMAVVGSANKGSLTNTNSLTVTTYSGLASPGASLALASFTQSAAGTLNLSVTNAALTSKGADNAGLGYAQISTTGAMNVAGVLNVNTGAGYYTNGSTFTILKAAGGISGSFSALQINGTASGATGVNSLPFSSFAINPGANAYTVTFGRGSTNYATALQNALNGVATLAPNEQVMANAFYGLAQRNCAFVTSGATCSNTTPSSDVLALVGAVDVMKAGNAQSFFAQLGAQGYGQFAEAMRDQANLFHREAQLRLFDDFESEGAGRGAWLHINDQMGFGGKTGGNSKQSVTGVQLGYDYGSKKAMTGLSLGYSDTGIVYAPGTLNGHVAGVELGSYSRYNSGAFNIEGITSYRLETSHATRTLSAVYGSTGALSRTFTGNSHGHLFKSGVTFGLNASVAGYKLRPFVGAEVSKGAISGFTEVNGGALDLNVGRLSANRSDFVGGVELAKKKGDFRPYARVAMRSAISAPPVNQITASFTGDPAVTQFNLAARRNARNEADLNLGVKYYAAQDGLLYLSYQGTVRKDMANHGIVIGFRMQL
jgi:uncharacterized protein with beta-barrel porin domain